MIPTEPPDYTTTTTPMHTVTLLENAAEVTETYRLHDANITRWENPARQLAPAFIQRLMDRFPAPQLPWHDTRSLRIAVVFNEDDRVVTHLLFKSLNESSSSRHGWYIKLSPQLPHNGVPDRRFLYESAWPPHPEANNSDDSDADDQETELVVPAAIHIDLRGVVQLPSKFQQQVRQQIRSYMLRPAGQARLAFAADPRKGLGMAEHTYEYWHSTRPFHPNAFFRTLQRALVAYKQSRPDLVGKRLRFVCHVSVLAQAKHTYVEKRFLV